MLIIIYAVDSQIVGVAVTSGRKYYANALASLIRRIDDGHLDVCNVAAYGQPGQVPCGSVEFSDIAQAFGRERSMATPRADERARSGSDPTPGRACVCLADLQVTAADVNGVVTEWTMSPEAERALAKVGAFIRSHFG